MENESILLGVMVGRLLLLSPFCLDSQICMCKLLVEVVPLTCPVEQVVLEFLHEKDVVLRVGILDKILVGKAVDSTF